MDPGAGGLPVAGRDVQPAGLPSQEEVTQRFQICIESKTYEQRSEQRPEQGGDRGGRLPRGSYTPLDGAPTVTGATGPAPGLVDVARSYAASAGIPHRRQAVYVEVDEARARRLADAYAAASWTARMRAQRLGLK